MPKPCMRGKMVLFASSPKCDHVENFMRKEEEASCLAAPFFSFFFFFPGSRLKSQVEEAVFSSGWVQLSWAGTLLLEWGKKSASCWQAARDQRLLGTQAQPSSARSAPGSTHHVRGFWVVPRPAQLGPTPCHNYFSSRFSSHHCRLLQPSREPCPST